MEEEEDLESLREKAFETTDKWYNDFVGSAAFDALTETQCDEADAIIEFFTDYALSHRGDTPEDWTPGTVDELCTDILPRKITAAPEFFESVSPVLTAFFTFLQEQSLHSKGKAMAATASRLHRKIVEASQDSSSWGMAKGLAMEALAQGVDIQSPDSMNAFIEKYNARLLPQIEKKATPPFTPPSNIYDPCPCGSGKKFKFCCRPKFLQ